MVYILGALASEEAEELERRGWELEDFTEAIGEIIRASSLAGFKVVFVDNDMFDAMNGPDWEKGPPLEADEGPRFGEVRNQDVVGRYGQTEMRLREKLGAVKLNMEKNADGIVGDDPDEDKEWSIMGWESDPEAEYTFNRGADTLVEAEFMGKALLKDEKYNTVGLIHNPTDQVWSVQDVESWEVTIRAVYRIVRKPPATAFWVVTFKCADSENVEIMWGPAEPSAQECQALFPDYEAEMSTHQLSKFGPFDVPQLPEALKKRPTPWDDDGLQFMRLLAELRAHLEISENTEAIDDDLGFISVKIKDLCESMDLPFERVHELFERADRAWEEWKHG
jgi:hypothetical protein